jgi:hypothetical protein
MLNGDVFYHGIIRKSIVSFGRLFSSIYIDRKQGDSVEGNTIQRLQVPISYAPKEKWVVRLDSDPDLNNHTYTTLPRMSFEITGYNYDASRKVSKMQKIACHSVDGEETVSNTMYSPVPYNLNISLYILTKTQEDALQIIEQILPTFAPEYTLAVQAVPEMNVIQDIPVLLDSISVVDEYDGAFDQRRFVTHTLTFTLKLNLFGATHDVKRIQTSMANVGIMGTTISTEQYTAEGDPNTFEIISEGWESEL